MRDIENAAGLAFAFHYHRDKMNAATHAGEPRFSPITFELCRSLIEAGRATPELLEVQSHDGKYAEDKGR